MPETYPEYRVKTYIDGQRSGYSEPTRDPREAGAIFRHNRDFLAEGGLGGEVSIERRIVQVGDWQADRAEKVEPRTGA